MATGGADGEASRSPVPHGGQHQGNGGRGGAGDKPMGQTACAA